MCQSSCLLSRLFRPYLKFSFCQISDVPLLMAGSRSLLSLWLPLGEKIQRYTRNRSHVFCVHVVIDVTVNKPRSSPQPGRITWPDRDGPYQQIPSLPNDGPVAPKPMFVQGMITLYTKRLARFCFVWSPKCLGLSMFRKKSLNIITR